MQNNKPEKILGKKFVRGKPYYKIKWLGAGKQLSTWQSPSRLKQFKSMINKYEVKNWGSPLDEKFFDSNLYEAKNINPRRKPQQKKNIKTNKKIQKRKMQQISSHSQHSQQQRSNPSQQQREQQQMKIDRNEFEEPAPSKKPPVKNREEEAPIIDLQLVEPQMPKEANLKQSLQKEPQKSRFQQKNANIQSEPQKSDSAVVKKTKKSNQINIDQLLNKKDVPEPQTNEIEYYKDLGLSLNANNHQKQVNIRQVGSEKSKKPLFLTNTLNLEIDRSLWITQIAHIYHLEKVNTGNHLYLVEFNDKQMRKMTTKELLDRHPNQLINFLEGRYKAKHQSTLI